MFERLLVVEGAHKRGSKSTPTFATECEMFRDLPRFLAKIVREVVAGPLSAEIDSEQAGQNIARQAHKSHHRMRLIPQLQKIHSPAHKNAAEPQS